MATVALTTFTPNAGLTDASATAAGSTNTISTQGVPLEEVVLKIVTTTATTVFTINAGDNPPALSAGQGDLAVSCVVGTKWIGPFTSARFVQDDGTLACASATAANQTITAYRMPRTA